MQIPASALPLTSPIIGYAFTVATTLVNTALTVVGGNIYALAVYNLAASNLLNFAQDQAGQTYFKDLRTNLKIGSFSAGVVQSASDNGSSESLLTPDFMKNLTLANLQQLKDPYGRQYLMFAQSFGPNVWGIS